MSWPFSEPFRLAVPAKTGCKGDADAVTFTSETVGRAVPPVWRYTMLRGGHGRLNLPGRGD